MANYRLPNQVGLRFGKLVVLSEIRLGVPRLRCVYRCDCGNECERAHGDVAVSASRGHVPCCRACLIRDRAQRMSATMKTHGLSKTKLYGVHRQMIQRCYNERSRDYEGWGARGIRVCEPWHDRAAFIAWAHANGYAEGLTIERVNNDGDYEPDNCAWIPNAEQCRNTRPRRSRKPCARDRVIEFNGKRQRLQDWCIETGISRSALNHRLARGWPINRALTAGAVQGVVRSVAELETVLAPWRGRQT